MAQVMFRCPYTNKPIAAGFDLHVASLRAVSNYPISVLCPHCGLRHHGTLADGCLAEDTATLPDGAGAAAPRPQDIASRLKKR